MGLELESSGFFASLAIRRGLQKGRKRNARHRVYGKPYSSVPSTEWQYSKGNKRRRVREYYHRESITERYNNVEARVKRDSLEWKRRRLRKSLTVSLSCKCSRLGGGGQAAFSLLGGDFYSGQRSENNLQGVLCAEGKGEQE